MKKIVDIPTVLRKLGVRNPQTKGRIYVGRVETYLELIKPDGKTDGRSLEQIRRIYKADGIETGRVSYRDPLEQTEIKDESVFILTYK